MKIRSLGFSLMIAGAAAYGAGCSSSNNNGGTGGHAPDGGGTGGHGTGGSGAGGSGTGGTGTGGANPDAKPDTPGDTPADVPTVPTFSDVFAIISQSADNSPGCAHCHDGVAPNTDGGAATTLPHLLNYTVKNTAYLQLVGSGNDGGAPSGVDSIVCATAGDGGAALKRVNPGNADLSVIVQKLRQGLGMGTACGGGAMPRQIFVPADGGADAGADAGFVQGTHYAITQGQLQTIVGWINAGALNN